MPVVLVADADPEFTGLLRVHLGTEGNAVDSASGGLERLERRRQRDSDLLVPDRERPNP